MRKTREQSRDTGRLGRKIKNGDKQSKTHKTQNHKDQQLGSHKKNREIPGACEELALSNALRTFTIFS